MIRDRARAWYRLGRQGHIPSFYMSPQQLLAYINTAIRHGKSKLERMNSENAEEKDVNLTSIEQRYEN